jgi:segregation and condensation protein A
MPVASASFAIKTEAFEGPLELLIELVEKRKLLINDISLAKVTDEYMQTVSEMQELSLPNTSQFINLAATLLLIKSKSLLPVIDLSTEEEASIEDLEERLKRYQIYRNAGLAIKDQFGHNYLYNPSFSPPKSPLFITDKYCDMGELQMAMHRVLEDLPKTQTKPTAKVKPTVSLEEMMSKLKSRIENEINSKFSDLVKGETERKNVIVGFLAILELFKQENLIISQTGHFEDIHLELKQTNTPKYY